MGQLNPQFHAALVIFLLTRDGEVATIGGKQFDVTALRMRAGQTERGVAAETDGVQREPLPEIAQSIRSATLAELPEGTTVTSIRALLPRFAEFGRVVLPLWTTGSLPRPLGGPLDKTRERAGAGSRGQPMEHNAERDEARLRSAALRSDLAHGSNALERLAHGLQDPSLVTEANSAFRQALAADPMVHQLVGDATRLRALAAEVSEHTWRRFERPLMAAMLPEFFTIDQLRFAVSHIAVAAGREVESSSNFRRRLADLMESGVLVDAGEAHDVEQRGRPPRLYRFEPAHWAGWLAQKARGDLAEGRAEFVQRSPRRKRDEADAGNHSSASKPASERSTGERTREELIRERLLRLSQVNYAPRYSRRAANADFEVVADDTASDALLPSKEMGAAKMDTVELPLRTPDRSSTAAPLPMQESERPQQAPESARIEQLEQLVSRLSNDIETGRAETNRLLRLVEEQLRARRNEGGEPTA